MSMIEMKGVAIPSNQITGVGDVKFEKAGRFSFFVDVPGNRYMQVYGSTEAANIARRDILNALNQGEPVEVDIDTTEQEPIEDPAITEADVDNGTADDGEDPGPGGDNDGKD